MIRNFFRKKKAEPAMGSPAIMDKAANKIANGIAYMQNGFTMFMNKRTQHFSSRTWKILIIVFGAAWSVLCIYFFASGFLKHDPNKAERKPIIMIQPMQPKYSDSLQLLEKIYEETKSKHNKH